MLGVKRSYFYNYGEKERVLLRPLCVYLNIWNPSDYFKNCVKSQCCYLRLKYPEPVMYSLQTNKIRLESDRNNIVYTHIRQHLVHYTTQPTHILRVKQVVLNRVGLINPHKTHISLPVGHLSPLQKIKATVRCTLFQCLLSFY